MSTSTPKEPKWQKWGQETAHVLFSKTITSPYSYVHLEVVTEDGHQDFSLDELMVKSYCLAALKRFLGLTGEAISMDILRAQDDAAWIRIHRDDLSAFSAAVTAYGGSSEGGTQYALRVKRSSDWLGSLVGAAKAEQVCRRGVCGEGEVCVPP